MPSPPIVYMLRSPLTPRSQNAGLRCFFNWEWSIIFKIGTSSHPLLSTTPHYLLDSTSGSPAPGFSDANMVSSASAQIWSSTSSSPAVPANSPAVVSESSQTLCLISYSHLPAIPSKFNKKTEFEVSRSGSWLPYESFWLRLPPPLAGGIVHSLIWL